MKKRKIILGPSKKLLIVLVIYLLYAISPNFYYQDHKVYAAIDENKNTADHIDSLIGQFQNRKITGGDFNELAKSYTQMEEQLNTLVTSEEQLVSNINSQQYLRLTNQTKTYLDLLSEASKLDLEKYKSAQSAIVSVDPQFKFYAGLFQVLTDSQGIFTKFDAVLSNNNLNLSQDDLVFLKNSESKIDSLLKTYTSKSKGGEIPDGLYEYAQSWRGYYEDMYQAGLAKSSEDYPTYLTKSIAIVVNTSSLSKRDVSSLLESPKFKEVESSKDLFSAAEAYRQQNHLPRPFLWGYIWGPI